ncbi:MAG: winged helix DNA-binding domain-containing protein [Acidimicrobiia bacterium]
MREISSDERRARLALRHGLAGPVPGIAEASRAMVGLHSSDPVTVYLSARARTKDMTPADVEEALYEEKTVVRMIGMRRTLFVLPREMAPIVHHSSSLPLYQSQRKRTARMLEEAGVTDSGADWVDVVGEKTIQALRRLGEATARELTAEIPELGEKMTIYKRDGSPMGTFGASTRILFLLAVGGEIVRGRPMGSWVSSMYRWATMERWLGAPLEPFDRRRAQAMLIRPLLRAFGPTTEIDVKWWTGWPVTQVRAALEDVDAVEVRIEGGTGWVLPDDVGPVDQPDHWVRLLPSLDSTTMGWKERAWYLGGHEDDLFDRNGNAGQTIWVDGKVVGGWAQRPTGEIAWELLERVEPATIKEIARQARLLSDWLDGVVVTPRFPSPMDKRLSR